MAKNEFIPVNWSPLQIIDEDSMSQMNSNTVYLRNQMVDGKYMHLNNGVVDSGIKILVGRKQITPRKKDTARVTIGFSKMFTPGSAPVITHSLLSPGPVKFFHAQHGIGQMHPDHRGFEVTVNVYASNEKNDTISKSLFVHWQAVGY